MQNKLALAIAIAAEAFKERLDKAGKPYILHCLRVMDSVAHHGEEVMQIAVLHDLVEDLSPIWSFQRLTDLGFSFRVIKALQILTLGADEDYDDYIKNISKYEDARIVKLADLKDNSDITRLKGLRKKDFDRMEKYHRSFVYLNND